MRKSTTSKYSSVKTTSASKPISKTGISTYKSSKPSTSSLLTNKKQISKPSMILNIYTLSSFDNLKYIILFRLQTSQIWFDLLSLRTRCCSKIQQRVPNSTFELQHLHDIIHIYKFSSQPEQLWYILSQYL